MNVTATIMVKLEEDKLLPVGSQPVTKIQLALSQDGVPKGSSPFWADVNGQNPVPVQVDVPDGTYLATMTNYAADNSQVGPVAENNVDVAHSPQLVAVSASVA